MNAIQELHALGQSLWYDNIQRRLLLNGDLAKMISDGDIRGVTSNPTIFNNAIAKTIDYDSALLPMAKAGMGSEAIFWQLAKEDIRAAADLFLPLYQETQGGDGYVSLEVSPFLANGTEGTIKQAKQLWQEVSRPNLMIKIPATLEGLLAISQAIAAGINVNVTLIFSLGRYLQVMDAFISGIEQRVKAGLAVNKIASVASFFVSRVDSKVDGKLQAIIQTGGSKTELATNLLGKAAIANARLAYADFEKVFSSARFVQSLEKGAKRQRPLWASTSSKNPAYRDVVYVEELIGPDTVNTVPPQTLDAFREHGIAHVTIRKDLDGARKVMQDLESLGISMDQVTTQLELEGVKSFADAFAALLKSIEERGLAAVK
jgi:transaldolase